MSSTIGEVNINLRMSLAQFRQDTADGTRAASTATKQMAAEMGNSTSEARGSLQLLGEEVGIRIPRHLTNFIATLPGVGTAMTAAFSSVAVIALIGLIVEAIGKVREFWESLGKLSESEQKLFDDATKKAKDLLGYQTTLLKAEFDLQIAKAQGLDKDRLRVEEMTALVGLNKNYADGLAVAKTHLEDLLNTQTALATKAMDTAKAAGVSPQSGANLWDMVKGAAAEKSAEGTKEKIDELTKSIGLANAALQEVQADSINAGDALDKHVAANAQKSKEQLDKISEAVFKLQSRLGVPENLQINVKIDPKLFEVGAMLEKLGQSSLPLYSGTKEAEDLFKIQNDAASAIAAAQKVYTSTRTNAEQYAQAIAELSTLLKQGAIDQQTYDRAVTEAKAKYDDLTIGLHRLGNDIADTLKNGSLWGSSWRDTLQSIAIEITQLILKMTLLKSLQSTTSAGGGGGVGGFFTSLLGGLFGGGKAGGGDVSPGHYYEWQESGREFFAPKVPGTVIPAGAMSDGGRPVQNFHMTVNGVADVDSFRKNKSQIAADVFSMMATATRRNR